MTPLHSCTPDCAQTLVANDGPGLNSNRVNCSVTTNLKQGSADFPLLAWELVDDGSYGPQSYGAASSRALHGPPLGGGVRRTLTRGRGVSCTCVWAASTWIRPGGGWVLLTKGIFTDTQGQSVTKWQRCVRARVRVRV